MTMILNIYAKVMMYKFVTRKMHVTTWSRIYDISAEDAAVPPGFTLRGFASGRHHQRGRSIKICLLGIDRYKGYSSLYYQEPCLYSILYRCTPSLSLRFRRSVFFPLDSSSRPVALWLPPSRLVSLWLPLVPYCCPLYPYWRPPL
jgi:hypothetical protein